MTSDLSSTAADNKRLMQEIFKQRAVGDQSLLRETLADDFRIVVMGQSSWSQVVEGSDAIRDYQAYVRSCFRDPGKTVAERFIADGDIVAVEARGDNFTPTGERYDNHYCLVFRFEGGKIAEMREYMDTVFCEQRLGRFPGKA